MVSALEATKALPELSGNSNRRSLRPPSAYVVDQDPPCDLGCADGLQLVVRSVKGLGRPLEGG